MDFKFLEIGTRIAIGQFDATIIEYDVMDGFSGLFPVYVARFDTGETEPVHHTDITGLIYDNPMPIEVIEGRKAYRAEHGDDAPDPTPKPTSHPLTKADLTIQHARFLQRINLANGDVEFLPEEDDDFFLQLNLLHMVFWHDDDEVYVITPEGYRWLKEFTAKAIQDGVKLATANNDDAPDPTPIMWTTSQFRLNDVVYADELKITAVVVNEHVRDGKLLVNDLARAASGYSGAMYIPIELLRMLHCPSDLHEELAAVTAERDALKQQLEITGVLPVVGQEVARYREALENITQQIDEWVHIQYPPDADSMSALVLAIEGIVCEALDPLVDE